MAVTREVRRMMSTPNREVLFSARKLRERVGALAELGLVFEVRALWQETVFTDGEVMREPCWELAWASEASV